MEPFCLVDPYFLNHMQCHTCILEQKEANLMIFGQTLANPAIVESVKKTFLCEKSPSYILLGL